MHHFVCLALALPMVTLRGQDPTERSEFRRYRPEEALICMDRKVVGPEDRGLYLRHIDGALERVWAGEPYDALWRLDGTVFLCERWTGKVKHLSREFEVMQTWDGFVNPVDVEVTADGLLIVVENGANRVSALHMKSGKRVWTRTGLNDPFDASVLPHGELLIADSGAGRVVHMDADGKTIREHRGLGFPNALESLDGGGFLVANWRGGEVRCYDGDGQLSWSAKPGGTLFSVERRQDGRTLVCDGGGQRVIIYDPKGRREKVESLPRGCVDFETILRL